MIFWFFCIKTKEQENEGKRRYYVHQRSFIVWITRINRVMTQWAREIPASAGMTGMRYFFVSYFMSKHRRTAT